MGLTIAFRNTAAKSTRSSDGATDGPARRPGEPSAANLPPDWRSRLPLQLDELVAAWRNPAAWEGTTESLLANPTAPLRHAQRATGCGVVVPESGGRAHPVGSERCREQCPRALGALEPRLVRRVRRAKRGSSAPSAADEGPRRASSRADRIKNVRTSHAATNNGSPSRPGQARAPPLGTAAALPGSPSGSRLATGRGFTNRH